MGGMWERTERGVLRVRGGLSGGLYEGRPIIGRDTPINGGVSIGGCQREALVVDLYVFSP